MSERRWLCLVATVLTLAPALRAQTPLGTAFTYQGQLKDLGVPADGLHDFEFSLWDADSGGNQVADPVQTYDVGVVKGLFTVEIDFGASAFNGDAVWLEVAVGLPGEALATLSPRQPLSATPYALQTRGMFVDENLNVGIGTDMPEGVLDVRGPNGGDIRIGVNDAGARVISTDAAGNLNLRPRVDGAGVFARDGNSSKGIRLYGGGTNRIQSVDLDGVGPFALSINPDGGNVGIGTSTPGATLHVDSASGGANIKLAGSEIADNFDGILRIRSGGGTVAFDGGDRVGIGTTTPDAALDLNGEMIHRGGALKHLGHDLIIADPSRGDGGRALVHWGDGTNERLDINFANDFDQGTFVHGNLGVGRAPNARLEVADGDIHLDANRELLFADNGQIRSRDDNHRILFRREDNVLELREYGDIVLSAGATTSDETASVVVKASGRVGIGTDNPDALLNVSSSDAAAVSAVHAKLEAPTGWNFAGLFESSSENGTGVMGQVLAPSGTTTGVLGQSLATAGATAGVRGYSWSPEGAGVHGANNSNTGDAAGILGEIVGAAPELSLVAGVRGTVPAGSPGGFGVAGIQGTHPGPYTAWMPLNGAGVYGYSETIGVAGYTGASGWAGVYGDTTGDDGSAVAGAATGNGQSYGGSFWSWSDNGRGVDAVVLSNDITPDQGPAGVQGWGGTAVRGVAGTTDGNGVVGIANGHWAFGIYGESDVGYAGYFSGDVRITGNLDNTGAKQSVIDHPLDPANRYLAHSSVESNERLNVYRGNVLLDDSGEATVQLPGWFDAVNANISYQLTAVGTPAPSLHVASEIKDRAFHIAGGALGMKVSWTVMAERADAYARAAPFVVDREKPEHERGYYLQPELHGHRSDKGMLAAKAALSERRQSDPELIAELERLRAEAREKWAVATRRQDDVARSDEGDHNAPTGE